MATTVRKGIFETNSSSSHSLSIEKVGDIAIIDGILNIDDLKNFAINYGNYYQNIISCDTLNKKLALAFAMMINEYNDSELVIQIKFDTLKQKYNIDQVIGNYSVLDDNNDIDELISIIDDDSYIVRSVYQSN